MSRARVAGVTATHEGEQVVILDFASIEIFYAGTLDPITEDIYLVSTGGSPVSQPIESDADGNFAFYLDAELEVKLRITHPDAGTLVADDVQVRAPAGTFVTLDDVQTLAFKKVGLQDGTVALPALYFESETGKNTGWYKTAEAGWEFTVDGVRKLSLGVLG